MCHPQRKSSLSFWNIPWRGLHVRVLHDSGCQGRDRVGSQLAEVPRLRAEGGLVRSVFPSELRTPECLGI